MSTFDLAIKFILDDEGLFSDNPKDPGNWTGGKVGIGELKGTKYGISAASYPQVDIKNITVDQAKEIYLKDFWNKYQYDKIYNQLLATKIFDMCINMGAPQAHKLCQRAIWAMSANMQDVQDDGILGAKTLQALNSYNASFLPVLRSEQAGFYRRLVLEKPHLADFLKGLLKRSYAL